MNLIIYIYFLILQIEIIKAFFNESLTIIEGKSVILSCKIPPKLDKNLPSHNCTWTRTRSTITRTKYTTMSNPLQKSKYISAGNIDAGDCSLNIINVQLETDEGIWTCALVFEDKSTILSRVNITVLVEPIGPKLYFKGTDSLIDPNSTIYLDPNLEVTINLKCVSQMAYPPTILVWKLNGDGIIPKSEESYSDIRPSTFITVSSLQITHPPSSIKPIQISCIAFHPSYPGVKTISANFTAASYAPSFARIQSGCELKDSEENEIFKTEENQILPLLCMTKAIPLPNVQWETKDEYNEWKPIFKHSLQFAIFIRSPGVYRCLTSNNLSERKAISPPVLVEMEHSKTVSSDTQYDDGTAHLEPRIWRRKRSFLVEPRNTKVVVNTPFKLNCILSTPIHNCTWNHNGYPWRLSDTARIDILNNYENGFCVLYFKNALRGIDNGDWFCHVGLVDGTIVRSRHAKVVIIHPPTSLILTYEGKKRVNGERIVVDVDEKEKFVLLSCEATLETAKEKIMWWINNMPETFPQTKSVFLSDNTYHISSSISLAISKLPKGIKGAEVYIKCTINNDGPEIALKLRHPTTRVVLFHSGIIYVEKSANLRVYCNANGKPSPEVSLQRRQASDWQWLKSIPRRRWFIVRRPGVYRCVAKNALTQNYVFSKSAIIRLNS